ncbi:uncharacterized protein LOC127862415 isoform X2 [Dreissena polymorpha]|uniref:uncharacterized protein LOC127862415 isoform X2 n=1 Tax=Dreissena polymorpha TaxID=45954 RepID=UPI002263C0A2|nr:uncharacterized protein LOC127862415 isoform X2 [Dreissena polymorpha]
MVIFFNINYLEQTIAARQNLLAKCLLTVPSHLNNIEPYIHRGSLPDDKYRFPWKRGRADEDFLLEQSTRHFKDICLLQTSAHTSGLFIEPYTDTRQADNNTVDTGTRNWSEGVNFNLDCDLIPSSNPSSGLDFDFTPDDFFTDKAQFEEFFVKEDLQQFDSNKDGWKLEESVQLLHVGTNLLCHRPTLGALMARLPTEEMEDPLEDATHINKDEKQYLTGEEDGNATLQSKQHYGATIFDESFHMEPIENDHVCITSHVAKTLEVPITADSCVPCSAKLREMQAMELANLTENIPLEQDKDDVRDILATAYGTQTLLRECGFPVPLSLAREPNTSITFLDVNEIILTEKDKFIEAAVLDTPQQSPEVKQKLSLSVPDRQAMAVDNAQSLFLTREEWIVLKQSLRQNEMYYDNVQASVLPEPKIAADYPITTIRCLQRTRALCLPQPASTGQLELRLSWDIVSYTCMVANPCRHLAVMRTKAEDVERPPLAEVEAIQKYDYLHMLDWQDAIISTRSCIELKQSTVENTKNGKGIMDLARLKSTIGKQSSHSNIDATDPISWFMALRSKQSTTIGDKCPKNQQIARTGVRFPEINSKTVTSDGLNYPVKIKANFEQNTRIKHHTVKIQLSDELLVIIHLLRSQAASFMENLQQLKVLQTGSRFDTINPGQTRLLLKQREKYLTENTVDVNTDDIFKNVLSLHMLCVACDIATNCCLESAYSLHGLYVREIPRCCFRRPWQCETTHF